MLSPAMALNKPALLSYQRTLLLRQKAGTPYAPPPTLNLIRKHNQQVSLRGTVASLPSAHRSREVIYERQNNKAKQG
jgi:hypothetical protein